MISRIVNRLKTSSSVCPKKRKRRGAVDELWNCHSGVYAGLCPRFSVSETSRDDAVSKHSVWRTLKKQRLHPYQVSPHQALYDSYFEKRSDFFNWGLMNLEEECLVRNLQRPTYKPIFLRPKFDESFLGKPHAARSCWRFCVIDPSDFPTRNVVSAWWSTVWYFKTCRRFLEQEFFKSLNWP